MAVVVEHQVVSLMGKVDNCVVTTNGAVPNKENGEDCDTIPEVILFAHRSAISTRCSTSSSPIAAESSSWCDAFTCRNVVA